LISDDKKQLTCVSLFSGAGGLDIGFERAGFATSAVCDVDPIFCETLRLNQGWVHSDGRRYFDGVDIEPKDVREIQARDLWKSRNAVDVVIGGPPCQAFSSAGKGKSVLDQRGQLVFEYQRLIAELKPRAFVFENVRGVVTARGSTGKPGEVIRELFDRLQDLGYSCRAQLLNAADYGAFQRRVRCFIVGVRNGEAPPMPPSTHQKIVSQQEDIFVRPWRTLQEFLESNEDLDESNYVLPTKDLRKQLHTIKDGSGLKSVGRAEPTRPGGHWGYRQGTFIADLTLPARTVTGSASQDWIRWRGKLRRLTFKEVAQLQGFPVDWRFSGPLSAKFKQVGNAVPTIFGEIIGAKLRDHLSLNSRKAPKSLDFPKKFVEYIDYTIRDHDRNKAARSIHKSFL
jgi:DNA (cytosine-5)-methyltransferase 1